jgi:DNA-binding transcriptional ArsR family regulator
MTQNKQINKSPELSIQIEFETLGNDLADYLLSLELKAIKKINTPSYEKQVKCLIDIYANQLDKILNNHKSNITRDIKKLTKCLLVDLKKQSATPSSRAFSDKAGDPESY